MMKTNRKKWICGLAAALCLTGSAVFVSAQTVDFNITIPKDPISKRAVKADDEQKFYVTGTAFNKAGTLKCTSSRLHSTVTSNVASISKDYPRANATYKSHAEPRYEYYMHCTASTSGLSVQGRYTP